MDGSHLSSIDQRVAAARMLQCLGRLTRLKRQRLFYYLFPDEDQPMPTWLDQIDGHTLYSRHRYPRHMEFFKVGAEFRERTFMAGNRVGKTLGGGYELACHLTGEYPRWWVGRRFGRPIRAWAAGKTFETTRDILQHTLLGSVEKTAIGRRVTGTGVIPGERIVERLTSWRQGVQDLVDTVTVQHVSGGHSRLGLKAYQQGRGSFEGTAQHFVLFDEEPPLDVYGEALIRTGTTDGIIALTFTPLEGISETVSQFMEQNDVFDFDFKTSLDMV